jgi:competence protein ComEC
VGWLANIFVVPLVGFAVIPLGLLAVGILPISTTLALWLWQGCLMVLSQILSLVALIADWPWSAVRTVTPSGIEIACYYGLLLSLFMLGKVKFDGPDSNGQRFKRWGQAMLVGVLVVAGIDAGYWVYQRFGRSDLRVTAIDVGQGSATLVEVPGGHTVLIDGGGFGDNSVFDVGARVVAPFLWRKKIKTVETLILSHPNSDHLNGLLFIAQNFNVRQFWSNGEQADNAGYRKLIQALRHMRIAVPGFDKLSRQSVINGVVFDILYPPRDFLARRQVESWRNSNNNSLVVKVSYGRRSVLVPGDIMSRGEAELVALKKAALQSCVLLAPHHGSKTGSSMPFLSQVNPQIVVISAGWKNRFGFPHPSVLRRYKDRDYRVFRTDQQGAITIMTDGSHLTVKPWL